MASVCTPHHMSISSLAGAQDLALEMFSDLRQYDQARQWADNVQGQVQGSDAAAVQKLIHKQAEWSEESNNYEAAADMYMKAKKYDKVSAGRWFWCIKH